MARFDVVMLGETMLRLTPAIPGDAPLVERREVEALAPRSGAGASAQR